LTPADRRRQARAKLGAPLKKPRQTSGIPEWRDDLNPSIIKAFNRRDPP
jgi:hypothetical protein